MNGKSKGSGFERKIAKALSLWLTDGKDSTQLIRTILSGGWQGRQSTQTLDPWRQAGDLAPNGPEGERFRKLFAVECKHHREINLYGLWTRNADGSLIGWWQKLLGECEKAKISPMLIFRANGMPIMVGMRLVLNNPLPGIPKTAVFQWLDLCVFPFDDLLKLKPTIFGLGEL